MHVNPSDATDQRPRALRADARRNRENVLLAAEEVFAAQGLGVPIDEVAKRAGVGVGTVYRHFPTKELLFEAIVISRVERLTDFLHELTASDDPGKAFFSFLEELSSQAACKRDLFDALANAGIDVKAAASESLLALRQSLGSLMQSAQRAGALRKDVNDEDVLGLVMATCASRELPGQPLASRERMLAIVFDGLRPS
jgi:AcrR family transcriptional regulator